MVSADYFEKYLSKSLQISHSDQSELVDGPIDFGITRSNVEVKGALNVRIVSAHYLGYNSLQSLLISHIDWS
jgi:hypothetical protein